MPYAFAFAPLFVLASLAAAGQPDAQSSRITAPVLLPPSLTVSAPKHCDEFDGIVRFAVTIDAAGVPYALKALEGSNRRLTGFAMELIEAQRFRPGAIDGSPAAVAVELTVGLHTCALREKHPTKDDFYQFTLSAHPLIALAVAATPAVQEIVSAAGTEAATPGQVGGPISAPIPTTLIDPEIPISKKLPKRGFCLLGITIDRAGVPQNIHVVRGLEPELDSNAIEAVKNWRFRPARREGGPAVAVAGTVVANFEYVDREPVSFATFIAETPEKVQAVIASHDKKPCDLKPLNVDEVIARYMPQSRIPGRSLVSLVIDTNGVPQNVHILKGLDSSLDMETVAMVQHLRFKPVMQDGITPVPVGLVVPVRYRVAMEKPTWRDSFVESLGLAMIFLF